MSVLLAALTLGCMGASAMAAAPVTVKAVSFHTDPSAPPGNLVAVLFRTSVALPRRADGHIGGRVTVGDRGGSSLSTVKSGRGRHCYVAYFARSHFRLHHAYRADFTFGSTQITRTLTLTKGTRASTRGTTIGC